MSSRKQLDDLSKPFYLEQRRWPFAHAALTALLYFALRDPVLCLLLCYVWESGELLLSYVKKKFKESMGDKLLGDPGVGALSIGTFTLLDRITGWDAILLHDVGVWWPFAMFVALMLLSFVAIELDPRALENAPFFVLHVGTLLLAALIIIALSVFTVFFPALTSNAAVLAIHVTWLTLAAAMRVEWPSTFLRVVCAQCVSLVLAGALCLI